MVPMHKYFSGAGRLAISTCNVTAVDLFFFRSAAKQRGSLFPVGSQARYPVFPITFRIAGYPAKKSANFRDNACRVLIDTRIYEKLYNYLFLATGIAGIRRAGFLKHLERFKCSV